MFPRSALNSSQNNESKNCCLESMVFTCNAVLLSAVEHSVRGAAHHHVPAILPDLEQNVRRKNGKGSEYCHDDRYRLVIVKEASRELAEVLRVRSGGRGGTRGGNGSERIVSYGANGGYRWGHLGRYGGSKRTSDSHEGIHFGSLLCAALLVAPHTRRFVTLLA